jgi:hydroxysqualene synthase
VTVDEAYRVCQRLAREHYENFPVASWLVPGPMRRHVAAVYAFARVADDFADEGDCTTKTRLARLAAWRRLLLGQPAESPHPDSAAIFTAVHATIEARKLDRSLFTDLLSAFEQDVTVKRYDTWSDVLDYCRRSANPVGRLVLALAGQTNEAAMARSDAVCTALQLTNFWQDFGRDWEAGRLYVPRDVLEAHGASELEPTTAQIGQRQVSKEWRGVFVDVVSRTDELFSKGRAVTGDVRGRLRYELRATWLGGTIILQRTAVLRRESFTARPALGTADVLRIARQAVFWSDRTPRSR